MEVSFWGLSWSDLSELVTGGIIIRVWDLEGSFWGEACMGAFSRVAWYRFLKCCRDVSCWVEAWRDHLGKSLERNFQGGTWKGSGRKRAHKAHAGLHPGLDKIIVGLCMEGSCWGCVWGIMLVWGL